MFRVVWLILTLLCKKLKVNRNQFSFFLQAWFVIYVTFVAINDTMINDSKLTWIFDCFPCNGTNLDFAQCVEQIMTKYVKSNDDWVYVYYRHFKSNYEWISIWIFKYYPVYISDGLVDSELK